MTRQRSMMILGIVLAATIAGVASSRASAAVDRDRTIDAGFSTTCGILASGQVACWGSDYETFPEGLPVHGADSVAIGSGTGCVVLEDRTVSCFGDAVPVQLDGWQLASTEDPVPIPGTDDTVALGVSGDSGCAVNVAGDVTCWGVTHEGITGRADESSIEPAVVGGVADAETVAMGSHHACAVTGLGSVWCWGGNEDGQLGDGSTTQRHVAMAVTGLSDVVDTVAGWSHTCALHSNGDVSCWGSNINGQLGSEPGSPARSEVPVTIGGISDVATLVSGRHHICALTTQHELWCWGANSQGQIVNDSDRTVVWTPEQIPTDVTLTELALGNDHTCAITIGDDVLCWGNNRLGQLGTETERSLVPVDLVGLATASDIGVGETHACAVSEGEVFCWGANDEGQLGDGTGIDSKVPVSTGITDALDLDVGLDHTCARHMDRTVSCWGRNVHYQVGAAYWDAHLSPRKVAQLNDVMELALGTEHSCALVDGDDTRCWGWLRYGQLGDGDSDPDPISVGPEGKEIPVAPVELGAIVEVAPGRVHTCWLETTGLVYCRGRGAEGQNGTADYEWWLIGPPVTGLTSVVDIDSGGNRSCAVQSNGKVWCWGQGPVGDGESHNRPEPWFVDTSAPATAVHVGSNFICAKLTNGGVDCWGFGAGAFGNGTTAGSFSPTPAGWLDTATTFAVNGETSCGIFGTTPRCMGSDSHGQLGRGDLPWPSTVDGYAPDAYFLDVDPDAFFGPAAEWLASEGITLGIGSARYGPDDPVTRAQMAAFLWRFQDEPEPESTASFADVPSGVYYEEAVSWLADRGITLGTGDGLYSPELDLTRAQMAAFMWRMEGRPTPAGPAPGFDDVPAGAYYATAVQWLAEQEITLGTSATTFNPDDPVTRAQMAAFLWRLAGRP